MVTRLVEALKAIRALGTTLIVVEQDASLALTIADRAYIIKSGQIELTGTSTEVRENSTVQQSFLGHK